MKPIATATYMVWALFQASAGLTADANPHPPGRELFETHCAPCHGNSAVGQNAEFPAGGWDDNGNMLAPALNGTGHAWHHSPSLIFQYIKEGSIDESSPMPSFKERISDDEIKSVIAYVQSLWPKEIMNKYKERFKGERE